MSTSMLNQPYAIPVATAPEIHGYRTARYIGPAFGVIARSMGFVTESATSVAPAPGYGAITVMIGSWMSGSNSWLS